MFIRFATALRYLRHCQTHARAHYPSQQKQTKSVNKIACKAACACEFHARKWERKINHTVHAVRGQWGRWRCKSRSQNHFFYKHIPVCILNICKTKLDEYSREGGTDGLISLVNWWKDSIIQNWHKTVILCNWSCIFTSLRNATHKTHKTYKTHKTHNTIRTDYNVLLLHESNAQTCRQVLEQEAKHALKISREDFEASLFRGQKSEPAVHKPVAQQVYISCTMT